MESFGMGSPLELAEISAYAYGDEFKTDPTPKTSSPQLKPKTDPAPAPAPATESAPATQPAGDSACDCKSEWQT